MKYCFSVYYNILLYYPLSLYLLHAAQQTVLVSLAHAVLDVQEDWIVGGGTGSGTREVMTAIEQDAEKEEQVSRGPEGSHDGDEDPAAVDDDGDEDPAAVDDDRDDDSDSAAADTGAASPTVTALLSNILAKETPEAVKLRIHFLYLYAVSKTHTRLTAPSSRQQQFLSKEDRQQLSEVAVKRAFSECPNLSILVLNLLKRPIYALHKHSCLSIGVPVAPMLAKPTKQITDVLKRLSGLAFTVRDSTYHTCHSHVPLSALSPTLIALLFH